MYRALYRVVGEPWHWRDQNYRPDAELRAHLDDAGVAIWGLRTPVVARHDAGGYAGYFELVQREPGVVEILYFGIVEEAIGHGLGGFLLTRAVEEAWAMGADRVVLNTCTLDSPHALPNYRARGFREVREEWYETELAGSTSDESR
jgi:GNAT superfamily N-acetyltransferase